MIRVLGAAASLRNARHGIGSDRLLSEIRCIEDQDGLSKYLAAQVRLRVDDFVEAGRQSGRPFDEIYDQLSRLSGEQGLSNSEAALAAGLWGAAQEGAEIDHLPLAAHFPPNNQIRHAESLRVKLLAADALIISGPVYFGDRGSLVQSLLDFIAADPELACQMKGKVYGGIAVGAKRNGGQETTLIYQMLDMVNLNFLSVGNSSETTSQYGGTAVGGDVGTVHLDDYGLQTSIGTGRRVARVAKLLGAEKRGYRLDGRVNIHMWLMQDHRDERGLRYFTEWAERIEAQNTDVRFTIWNIADGKVTRCIGCDVCPTSVGPSQEYRCIISSKQDFFVQNHAELIRADALLLCAYSPEDRTSVRSVYQQFIERTRYLRRDDYVYSDLLVAPFVVTELSARQNLHLRMITSMVRHHTVIHHPLIGVVHEGAILNAATIDDNAASFIQHAKALLVGRCANEQAEIAYNPVGYSISAAKTADDLASGGYTTLKSIRTEALEKSRSRVTCGKVAK